MAGLKIKPPPFFGAFWISINFMVEMMPGMIGKSHVPHRPSSNFILNRFPLVRLSPQSAIRSIPYAATPLALIYLTQYPSRSRPMLSTGCWKRRISELHRLHLEFGHVFSQTTLKVYSRCLYFLKIAFSFQPAKVGPIHFQKGA